MLCFETLLLLHGLMISLGMVGVVYSTLSVGVGFGGLVLLSLDSSLESVSGHFS